MRRKERNGPGIVTLADSRDPTLASDGKESEGTLHRTAGARHEQTERVAARMLARQKRAHRFAGKWVKRSVQALKISSPKRRSEERRVGKEGRSRWSPDH